MAEEEIHNSTIEYPDGTVYHGNWILLDGKKVKHGYGRLSHARIVAKQPIKDEYVGNWNMDLMEGYGEYKYASGAVYKGDWKNNRQHGNGFYFFADGSFYEGEWNDHKMHGKGLYVDMKGRKWEGEFVNGTYKADQQKMLLLKRVKDEKIQLIKEKTENFMNFFICNFAADKKKMLEHSKSIFVDKNVPDVSKFYSGAVMKYSDKRTDVWLDNKGKDRGIITARI